MKSVFVGFLLCLVSMVSAESIKDLKDNEAICRKEMDLKEIDPKKSFSDYDEKEKCFLACVLEKDGVLKEDGSVDFERGYEILNIRSNGKSSDKLRSACDKCAKEAKIIAMERCETAFNVVKCVQKLESLEFLRGN